MRVLTVAVCVLSFVCSVRAAGGLPQLFALSEPGVADAELIVQRIENKADGKLAVTAAALAGTEKVAIQVIVPVQWPPSKTRGGHISFSSGTIKLRSVGKETEAFVRALAKAYQQKVEQVEFSEVTLAATALRGEPGRVSTAPLHMKVSHESESLDGYAEALVNIDLQRGIVQIFEKDPEYRKAMIALFAKKKA